MWYPRIRLRQSIKKVEEEKTLPKLGGYAFRKAIHDKHAMAFFFIGMSIQLNLDTSLLTQTVFEVENFANITLFMYFGVLVSVSFLYLFLIEPDFSQLLVSLWSLTFCRVCHLIISIFSSGKTGRNLYLIFYTIMGMLRGFISLSSVFVISKYFLNKAYLHLVNGGVMFSILLSVIQMACDSVIGSDTIKNSRKSLVIAEVFNLLCTIIGSIWIAIVFYFYNTESFISMFHPELSGIIKSKIAIKKFQYSKFYLSKLMIVIIASTLRVSFIPVLLPYMMDIEYSHSLFASIIFTVFEFVGRLAAFRVDEYIDPSKKGKSTDQHLFLLLQDVPMYLMFLVQFGACTIALYSTWNQKFGISKNPTIVGSITLYSGFTVGFTSNRAFVGAQASLEYFSYLNSKKNVKDADGVSQNPPDNIITSDVVADTSNANDILTMFNYLSYVVGALVSYTLQKIIIKHKDTAIFIIKSRKDRLDFHSVNSLVQKLKIT